MEKFLIEGGRPLAGKIKVLGAKNAALPTIAGAVLSEEKSIIENVPEIGDVFSMLEILKSIGVKIKFLGKRKIEIDPKNVNPNTINYNLVAKIRSSVFLLGVLSARCKEFKLSVPGGCQLGARILDPHIDALLKLGVNVKKDNKFFLVKSKKDKKPKREIVLSEMSVTATENVILASVLSEGETTIYCAAVEHYISDLCHFLNKMGAKITGAGTHTIKIKGVKKLFGAKHYVMPDPIEMGTFMALAAGTKSKITIEGFVPEFLRFELLKFKEANVKFKVKNIRDFDKGWGYKLADIEVFPSKLKAVKKLHNLPYPGLSPDLLPIFAVLMTQAEGVSLIHDWMYEGRMRYIDELNRMGANAFLCDPHRALITGPTKLEGKDIKSFDLRAGATLIIASLMAKGKSEIEGAEQVDRGYEKIEVRLKKIGAKIKRIKL